MIRFWCKKKAKEIRQGACILLTFAFIFSILAPSYAQAKIYNERRLTSFQLRTRSQSMAEASASEKAAFLEKISPTEDRLADSPTLAPQLALLHQRYQKTLVFIRQIQEQAKIAVQRIFSLTVELLYWFSQKNRWKWAGLFLIAGIEILLPNSGAAKWLQALNIPLSLATIADLNYAPHRPKRKFRLAQVVTVIDNAKKMKAISEDEYRNLVLEDFIALPENLYPKENERRLDTYLKHQAASGAQAILELIANGQDASVKEKKIGRFGVGVYQALGDIKQPEDRVFLESSKDGIHGTRFIFWLENGEVYFDYEIINNSTLPKGTYIRVKKRFSKEEVIARRKFIERKLRVNTKGAILWEDGAQINHPEDYLYVNGEESGVVNPDVAPVIINVTENGYEVRDSGVGMGLKEIFERYMIPKQTDKPLTGAEAEKILEETRCFYKPGSALISDGSLWLSGVEIEPHLLRGKANLVQEAIFELPHDTDISEERGVLNLVPSSQQPTIVIHGMKRMIDKLVDPARPIENRFALINTLVALLEIKQPKGEKGLIQGNLEEATDLVWYLKEKLNAPGGLMEEYRGNGYLFLPNDPEWSRFQFWSGHAILLDKSLLETNEDLLALFKSLEDISNNALFESLQDLKPKILLAEFEESAQKEDPIIVQTQENGRTTIILDKAIFQKYESEPEILIARLKKSLRRNEESVVTKIPEPPRKASWFHRLKLKVALPLIFIVGTVLTSAVSSTVLNLDVSKQVSLVPKPSPTLIKSEGYIESLLRNHKFPTSSPSPKNRWEFPNFNFSLPLDWLQDFYAHWFPLQQDMEALLPKTDLSDFDTSLTNKMTPPFNSTYFPEILGNDKNPMMLKYGTVHGNIHGPLITGIYPHMDENGKWDLGAIDLYFGKTNQKISEKIMIEAKIKINRPNRASADSQEMSNYRSWLNFSPYQILDGEIVKVEVKNANGRPVKYEWFKTIDSVKVYENYKGTLEIKWWINQYSKPRDLIYKVRPLPEEEIRDFPAQWKTVLDHVKLQPDKKKWLFTIFNG